MVKLKNAIKAVCLGIGGVDGLTVSATLLHSYFSPSRYVMVDEPNNLICLAEIVVGGVVAVLSFWLFISESRKL